MIYDTLIYLPRIMAKSAGEGNWLPILLNAFIFGFAAMAYVKLNSLYKGKMLFEYSSEIAGKLPAYILGILFILHFLSVGGYLLGSFTNTLKNNFLLRTPAWFEMLFAVPIFGYAANKGITNIARMAEIIGFFIFIALIFVHVAMLLQGNTENILPFYNPYETGRYLAAMKDAIVPYLGVELLSFIPFTLQKPKKTMKTAFFAVFTSGLAFILVVMSTIAIIGMQEVQNYTDPTIAAIRQVEIRAIEFLTRVDMVFLTIGLSGFFLLMIVEYCAVVEFASKLFPKVKRLIIVIAAGLALFILGCFSTDIDDLRNKFDYYAQYAVPFTAIFVPLLLLILAKRKKNA